VTRAEQEMAYDLGERVADKYSGIRSKVIDGVNHYAWKCQCGAVGNYVKQPSREEYAEIRNELARHERAHAAEENGNAT